MSWKTTVVLMVLALGVGAFFIFGYSRWQGTDERKRKDQVLVDEPEVKGLSRIEIKSEKEELVLEYRETPSEKYWEFVRPAAVPTAKIAMDDFLAAARKIYIDAAYPQDKLPSRQEMGLEPPRLMVTLSTPSNKIILRFGKESGFKDDTVWTRKEGDDKTYGVSKATFDRLHKKFSELRDRDLARYESWKVERMVVTSKLQRPGKNGLEEYTEDFELVRKSDGWVFTRPFSEAADDSSVRRFLDDLRQISVEEFQPRPEKLDEFGLERPDLNVELFEKGAVQPVRIQFGNRTRSDTKKMFALNPAHGDLAVIMADRYERLPKQRDDFRSKEVFNIRDAEARRLTLTLPWKTLDLAKEEREVEREIEKDGKKVKVKEKVTEWVMKSPAGGHYVTDLFEYFVRTMLQMKVTAFLDRDPASMAQYHLDPPAATISIVFRMASGAKETRTVHIGGAPSGSVAYLVRPPEKQVYEIQSEYLDLLNAGDLNLMDPTVLQFKKENVLSFLVQVDEKPPLGRSIRYACEKEPNGKWKWSDAAREAWKDFEVDGERINLLLARMERISAQKFLSDRPEAVQKYRLNEPEVTLTLRFEKEEGGSRRTLEKSLVITGRVGYNTIAKFVDSPVVFQLDPFFSEALKEGVHKKPQGSDGHEHQ